jgi:hypothetical protein
MLGWLEVFLFPRAKAWRGRSIGVPEGRQDHPLAVESEQYPHSFYAWSLKRRPNACSFRRLLRFQHRVGR